MMKLIPQTDFDSLVFSHSTRTRVEEKEGGVVRLAFGPTEVLLAEDSAREFLYDLTAFFAQKDLAEYEDFDAAAFQETADTLRNLSLLRNPNN